MNVTANPDISFQFLITLVPHTNLQTVLKLLAAKGITMSIEETAWQPLLNDMEYNTYRSDTLEINGISCILALELIRNRKASDQNHISGYNLTPAPPSNESWINSIRNMVAELFTLTEKAANGTEYYQGKNNIHCALSPRSRDQPRQLLLYRKTKIRHR
ncbi:MAG: hypothetical protein AMJ53_04690 [Gammaproteobacteria bacterium SG8_11]|nr:MAG: hypothetical protein AMJ53_04690 [Gammaproteobacteria bacterium SG8_11]